MPLIDCPECGKQVSSAAVSCPECGYPIAQEAQKAPSKAAARKRELRKQTNKRDWRLLAGFAIPLLVAVEIFNWYGRDAPEPVGQPSAKETQEAQRCDSYKKGIKAAMPDLFNGDVRREIECDRSTIEIRIRGSARRQPDAERVLALTVSQLAEQGINPRRDEVALALFIYQTGKTVTGGPGSTELTSAWYSPVSDSVERLPAD